MRRWKRGNRPWGFVETMPQCRHDRTRPRMNFDVIKKSVIALLHLGNNLAVPVGPFSGTSTRRSTREIMNSYGAFLKQPSDGRKQIVGGGSA